jgi:hypothetical protein
MYSKALNSMVGVYPLILVIFQGDKSKGRVVFSNMVAKGTTASVLVLK